MAALFDGAAEHLQLALLQLLHPGDQAQQARLAGAIRADQSAAGTAGQAEGEVDQGLLRAIAMIDARGLQRQFVHCRLAGQPTVAVRT